MRFPSLLSFAKPALVGLCLALAGCHARTEVKAPKRPTSNTYHGVRVVDDYQWLENGADPAVRQWSAAQNERARTVLDKLPTRPLVADRLARLLADGAANYSSLNWRRGRLFLLKSQPPSRLPVLAMLSSVTNLNSEQVIVDPNQLSTNGATAIDWYVPSQDGTLVAVLLSQNESGEGALHIY